MKPLETRLPNQQWVDERRNYIGGSEVAAILCESEYQTPLQVWLRKRGDLPPIDSTPIMSFGNYFEPIMASYFEDVTGYKTRQISKTYEHPDYPFLRANIDRMVIAGNGLKSTAVLELKTTTSHRMKATDGVIPREWFLQIQFYLGITGYEVAFLQIYERDTCHFHEPQIIDRNDDLIIDIMSKMIKWWKTHMIQGKRPAPINSEDTLILYPDSTEGITVEATPSAYSLYNELMELRDRKQALEAREDFLKTALQDKIGDAEKLVLGGRTLISWKSQSTNRLDTQAIRENYPDIYSQNLKQTQSRRFLCH